MKENSINKPKFVEKDLDLFESINKGKEKHLEGSESLPPIIPLTKAHDVAYVRFSVPDLKLYAKWIIMDDMGFFTLGKLMFLSTRNHRDASHGFYSFVFSRENHG